MLTQINEKQSEEERWNQDREELAGYNNNSAIIGVLMFAWCVWDRLTGDQELCVSLGLSCSAASEALVDPSVSRLHPAHRQPGRRGDLVSGVRQFGKRHGVLVPLDPGLGHAYACARARVKHKEAE